MNIKRRDEKAKEHHHVGLDPLRDHEDVDAYISHFERVAALCNWASASWSSRLVALLRGKARDAILRLDPEKLVDYEEVKSALLKYFRLDADAYRLKFRNMKKEKSETYEQLLDRLKACLKLWIKSAGKDGTCVEQVTDLFLQEQLLDLIPHEVSQDVRKEEIECAEEVAERATKIAEAKRPRVPTKGNPGIGGCKEGGDKREGDDGRLSKPQPNLNST